VRVRAASLHFDNLGEVTAKKHPNYPSQLGEGDGTLPRMRFAACGFYTRANAPIINKKERVLALPKTRSVKLNLA